VAKFIPYPGSKMFADLLADKTIALNDEFFLDPMDSYSGKAVRAAYARHLNARQLNRWMIWLYLNFYVIHFVRRPLRVLHAVWQVMTTGYEETRYAKWFRDRIRTRGQWRQSAQRKTTPMPAAGEKRISLPVLQGAARGLSDR
jgi:hypothetical protein